MPHGTLRYSLETLSRGSRGSLMVETVVAVMVLAMVGGAILGGVSVAQVSGSKSGAQATADNLARNQMEHVFSLPYQEPPSTYPSLETPAGFTITATAEEYVAGDPNIEKVVVQVDQGGTPVLTLETLRTK